MLHKYLYRDASRLLCLQYNTSHCAAQEFTLISDNLKNTAQWKRRLSGKYKAHNIDNILKHKFFSGTGNWSFPEFNMQNTIPVEVVIREKEMWVGEEKCLKLENNLEKGTEDSSSKVLWPAPTTPFFSHTFFSLCNPMRYRKEDFKSASKYILVSTNIKNFLFQNLYISFTFSLKPDSWNCLLLSLKHIQLFYQHPIALLTHHIPISPFLMPNYSTYHPILSCSLVSFPSWFYLDSITTRNSCVPLVLGWSGQID